MAAEVNKVKRPCRGTRRFVLRTERHILAALVELEKAGFGMIGPGLEECYRMGMTHQQALANLREGIRMHEDDMMAHEELEDWRKRQVGPFRRGGYLDREFGPYGGGTNR